jgi:hypothetical protein
MTVNSEYLGQESGFRVQVSAGIREQVEWRKPANLKPPDP